jgi:hypothetical protein
MLSPSQAKLKTKPNERMNSLEAHAGNIPSKPA